MDTIISGSRRVTNYTVVETAIQKSGFTVSRVIEGGQRTWDKERRVIVGGVDFFAAKWADKHGVPCKTFYANWSALGKAAGPIRNRKMAREGRQLIAIPDAESVGTFDMIEAAREAGFQPSQIYIHSLNEFCDNCKADGQQTEASITLGDGMRLCADCWEDCKSDCEPIR